MVAAAAGKKRASPGAEDQKNLFDVEITDEQHAKLMEAEKDLLRIELVNDRENHKRLAPVYVRRRKLIKEIGKFWPVALMNHQRFADFVQHPDDQKALLHLEDLVVVRHAVESRVFSIEMYFSANPYFSDSVLKKEYKYIEPPAASSEKPDEDGILPCMLEFDWERDVEPQATKISWKDEAHNLTKLHPQVRDEDGDLVESGSFFNFFEKEGDPADLGILIGSEVYPDAVDWFTGKAATGEEFVTDEEDSEEDEDDDAEEIDLEKPETKRARRN